MLPHELLFAAHMGSVEVLLAHGRSHCFNSCIALGQMDSMLTIHHKQETGALVGVLADRAAGQDQYLSLPFLGAPARFPTTSYNWFNFFEFWESAQ